MTCARDASTNLDRYHTTGPSALSDAELLALALGVSEETARGVLEVAGGVRALASVPASGYEGVPGIGPARAGRVAACLELGKRAAVPPVYGVKAVTPHQVTRLLSDLRVLDREEMHVVSLDACHRVISKVRVAEGALNVVHLPPREVMQVVIRARAAAFLLAHNHPSGDAIPSNEDIDLTARIKSAGDIVGVPMLDHFIIADGGWSSCAEGWGVRAW